MDRSRLAAPAIWMLIVAPLVSAGRAAMAVAGIQEPGAYWIGFALGGSLSGLGILLLVVAWWDRGVVGPVIVGAVVAATGHYLVPGAWLFGPAMVQLGTGLVLWPRTPWAPIGGLLAGSGAVLRHLAPLIGNALLLLGAIALAVAVVTARSPDMHSRR